MTLNKQGLVLTLILWDDQFAIIIQLPLVFASVVVSQYRRLYHSLCSLINSPFVLLVRRKFLRSTNGWILLPSHINLLVLHLFLCMDLVLETINL